MRLCCKIGKENQKGSPSETALNERESIEKYVASPPLGCWLLGGYG
jgi:hypothetical protein